jgi:hypothetical protein
MGEHVSAAQALSSSSACAPGVQADDITADSRKVGPAMRVSPGPASVPMAAAHPRRRGCARRGRADRGKTATASLR